MFRFGKIVTENDKMASCLKKAESVSATDVAVLILGKCGTGKTFLAEEIHKVSARSSGPCVVVSCSALAETLLESELFGHEKGAFTSAERSRKGRFEIADGGTLVLDEIGDMSLSAQAKILRAVEYKEFERIGGESSIKADVRIIATTNRDIPELISEGKFREDLFYRLNEVTLEIPPLRERKEDISPFVDKFINTCNNDYGKQITGVSDITLKHLEKYSWPGNVRELQSAIKRGVTVADRDTLWLEDMDFKVGLAPMEENIPKKELNLKAVEKKHIQKVLRITGGNKRQTCMLLGISRPSLDKKIKSYQILV